MEFINISVKFKSMPLGELWRKVVRFRKSLREVILNCSAPSLICGFSEINYKRTPLWLVELSVGA